MKIKNNKGFSLFELSIVLIISSIMIGGFYLSSRLINSSRLANAINLTAQINLTENSNLVLWLETTNIGVKEVSSSEIKAWNDLSINQFSFQSSENPPLLKGSKTFRGINSINFNENAIKSQSPLNLNEYTIFVVANPTLTQGNIYNFGFSLKSSEMLGNRIVILKNDGVEKSIKLNNKSDFHYQSASDIPEAAQDTNFIGDNNFKGEIFEIIMFNKVLNENQIDKIEDYLYNKYSR